MTAGELRGPILRLVGAVTVVHITGIVLHRTLHIDQREAMVRYVFGGIWTGLTLLIVLRGLARVRALRLRRRSAMRGARSIRNQEREGGGG
jgi:hypothetical protein